MISALAQLLLQKGDWNGEQLIPAWWTEEIGKMRVVIPEDEKKALTHYAYHIKAGKEIFAAEGAFGQYLVCFRELPVAIGITAGAREYLAADICLKYMKEAVSIPCPEEKREEGEKYLEAKIKSLSLPQPEGRLKTAEKELSGLFNREIIFTENPRNIESAKIIPEGCKLRLEMIVQGEKKIAYAGFKSWKQNDLYPDDFTKRYPSIAYGMAQEKYFSQKEFTSTEELVAGSPEYAFNEYLQIAVEYGVLFLLVVLLIIVFCLWIGITEKRLSACAGLISVLVFALCQ